MSETLQYKIDMDFRSQWKIVSTHSAVKSNFIYVQEIGEFRSGPNYFTKREGVDSFLLKLTLSGSGILEYEGKTYTVKPSQFFLIDCQKPQHYYTDPEIKKWHILWVHFYGATARAYYEMYREMNRNSPVCAITTHFNCEDQLRKLLKAYSCDGISFSRDMAGSALLTELLSTCICAATAKDAPAVAPEIVLQIQNYLHENFTEQITLDTLSRQFSISKYHMQRLFKLHIGQSPTEYLLDIRLNRARELLCTTNLPVREIAYQVGIGSSSYFIQRFRQKENSTPEKYRKSRSM